MPSCEGISPIVRRPRDNRRTPETARDPGAYRSARGWFRPARGPPYLRSWPRLAAAAKRCGNRRECAGVFRGHRPEAAESSRLNVFQEGLDLGIQRHTILRGKAEGRGIGDWKMPSNSNSNPQSLIPLPPSSYAATRGRREQMIDGLGCLPAQSRGSSSLNRLIKAGSEPGRAPR